jgi:hypothetical protein
MSADVVAASEGGGETLRIGGSLNQMGVSDESGLPDEALARIARSLAYSGSNRPEILERITRLVGGGYKLARRSGYEPGAARTTIRAGGSARSA